MLGNKDSYSTLDNSDINVHGFIENVIKMFRNKRKVKLLRTIFQAWMKMYYENSIRHKAIEIELKKKHYFNLAKTYFTQWREAMYSAPISVREEIVGIDNRSYSAMSHPVTYEFRIAKYEESKIQPQDSGNKSSYVYNLEPRCPDVSYIPKSDKYMVENYSSKVEIKDSNFYNSSSDMRQPYKSNIETVESEDRVKKYDESDQKSFVHFTSEKQSITSERSYDMPLKAIRVTNHKQKSTIQETLGDEGTSSSNDDQGGIKRQLSVIPMSTTMKTSVTEELEDLTPQGRLSVLRKIFLKWCIQTQNAKMARIRDKFESI